MTTRRLVLRRFLKSDGEGLYDYLSDPEVVKFEPYEPYTREMAEQEAARRAEDQNFWAVCLLDGALLGNVYFAEGEFDTWELGYVFNRKYWGMHRVTAMCNPENERSWRLLERLGMRREGNLRKNIFFFRNEQGEPLWQDTYEYGLLREEWEQMPPVSIETMY